MGWKTTIFGLSLVSVMHSLIHSETLFTVLAEKIKITKDELKSFRDLEMPNTDYYIAEIRTDNKQEIKVFESTNKIEILSETEIINGYERGELVKRRVFKTTKDIPLKAFDVKISSKDTEKQADTLLPILGE